MKIFFISIVLAALSPISWGQAGGCSGCQAFVAGENIVNPVGGATIDVPPGEDTVSEFDGACALQAGDCGQRAPCEYTSTVVISGIGSGQTGQFDTCKKEASAPPFLSGWVCGTSVPVGNGNLGPQTITIACGLVGEGRFSITYNLVTSYIIFDTACNSCGAPIIED